MQIFLIKFSKFFISQSSLSIFLRFSFCDLLFLFSRIPLVVLCFFVLCSPIPLWVSVFCSPIPPRVSVLCSPIPPRVSVLCGRFHEPVCSSIIFPFCGILAAVSHSALSIICYTPKIRHLQIFTQLFFKKRLKVKSMRFHFRILFPFRHERMFLLFD